MEQRDMFDGETGERAHAELPAPKVAHAFKRGMRVAAVEPSGRLHTVCYVTSMRRASAWVDADALAVTSFDPDTGAQVPDRGWRIRPATETDEEIVKIRNEARDHKIARLNAKHNAKAEQDIIDAALARKAAYEASAASNARDEARARARLAELGDAEQGA